MKRACTIGSATQDVFIEYEGADTLHLQRKKDAHTYLLLEQGTKIDIEGVHYAAGGGATNVAVGLSRLGISVEAFFKTGDDLFGKSLRAIMNKESVGTLFCPVSTEYCTALSIIIPSYEHDHAALCYRAANHDLKKEEFPLELLNNLDLLFIGPLGGTSQDLLPFLAPQAAHKNIRLVVNPSVKQLTHEPNRFIEVLPYIDTLIVNMRESGYVMKALHKESLQPQYCLAETSEPLLSLPFLSFGSGCFSLQDIIKAIQKHGPKTVIVTNGKEGVYAASGHELYFHPTIPVTPVSSLGAGDAFSSGFLGAQLHGATLLDALRFGILNAVSVIQHSDAQQGLLIFDRLKSQAGSLNSAFSPQRLPLH